MISDELLSRSQLPRVLYVNVYPFRMTQRGPEYLLLRRLQSVVLPGVWQPISGKLAAGESISAAFASQIAKKTGGPAEKLVAVDYVNTYYDAHYDAVMLVPCTAALLAEREIRLDTQLHDASCWIPYEALADRIPFAGQLEAYARVHAAVRSAAR